MTTTRTIGASVKKTGFPLPLTSLVLCATAVLAPLPAAAQQLWQKSFPLSPHGSVSVVNIHGTVRIEGWDRAGVRVEVLKISPAGPAALETVRVGFESEGDHLSLRTEYLAASQRQVRVEYRLWIPRQAAVAFAGTVEGDVELRGLEGAVSAHALNGRVTAVNLGGEAVLRATNGSVSASFRRLPGAGGLLRLESITGDVTLVLPAGADADLTLETVAGSVMTPYLVRAAAALDQPGVRARAGRGGLAVHLSTVSGDIRVVERAGDL